MGFEMRTGGFHGLCRMLVGHSTRKVGTVRCVRGLSLGACAGSYMRVLSVVSTICVPGLYPVSSHGQHL